ADVAAARAAAESAGAKLAELRDALDAMQARKAELQAARDAASSELAEAKAELSGVQREWEALKRDRDARERAAAKRSGRHQAIDGVRAAKGYERAVAAALGRDGKALLGAPEGDSEGRYWTGAEAPSPVSDSLSTHVESAPDELRALLALVHVAESDDGRALAPGHALVTLSGQLRRWDGLVVRGEGSAEAARLEAENRFAELDRRLPALREAAGNAQSTLDMAGEELAQLQRDLVARERELAGAADAERQALRALDQAEAARERLAARLEELARNEAEHAETLEAARAELDAAQARRDALPDPEAGRAALEAARTKNEASRATLQARAAELASHDQSLAVARERAAAQRSDMANWQARSGDAARRLSELEIRAEEIEQDRAVTAAKPEGLMREIEQGDQVRERLARELAAAEAAVSAAQAEAQQADSGFAAANEALAKARENRAGLAERAENQDGRRIEMARIAGARFQCPPPLLPQRFEFEEAAIRSAEAESDEMDRLTASRERIGPVNLVAAEELERI
ncbi:MAG: chromosome segregation protein, partial [Pseudomonadota bacterium]|nr:chromosome segregation protein [Pseudomonadota bacterium]